MKFLLHFSLLLLALSAGLNPLTLKAQPVASEKPKPNPAPVFSPFREEEELQAVKMAEEAARQKEERLRQEEKDAVRMKEEKEERLRQEEKDAALMKEEKEEKLRQEEKAAARAMEQKAAAEAAILKQENRRVAIQMAVAPIKVLARGIQKDKSVALLALDGNRRIMVTKGDTMTLNTTAGAVEITLVTLTRQMLSFQTEDGTLLPIQ